MTASSGGGVSPVVERALDFVAALGIFDFDHEHEAVELGFGKRVGAFLLDRVLRGEHEIRGIQLKGASRDGNAVFLHRFEHGRLRFGGGAVDLVGEDDVGKNGTLDEFELAATALTFLKDVGAGDVHRHEVGRKLNPAEIQMHGLGQAFDEQRFGEAGDAHEERMAAGEKANRQMLNHRFLTHDDLANLILQLVIGIP